MNFNLNSLKGYMRDWTGSIIRVFKGGTRSSDYKTNVERHHSGPAPTHYQSITSMYKYHPAVEEWGSTLDITLNPNLYASYRSSRNP